MRAIAAKSVAFVWLTVLASSMLLAANPSGAWQSIGPAPPAIGAAIAAHAPSHTIYIVGEGRGVLKSTDGGSTFVTVNNEIAGAVSMVMDPNDPNVVYTGGFKTTDGGVTWVYMDGHAAGIAFAMDPTNSNILYADVGGGVEKTVDGGVTWETVSQGLWSAVIWPLVINPFDPNVLFVGSNGDGAFKSVDGGATWASLDIDSTVWGLLVDPDDGNIVYAGSNGDGVYKSTDGGDSFARVGSPDVGVVFSIVKSGNRLYAGTAGGGVSVSEDGGVTWTNTGVSQSQGLALSVDSAGSVYLGTNFDGAFMLPADSGTWHRLAWDQLKTCACQLGHALAIDPSNYNHIFFTTNDGGLLVTNDGGVTWQDGGVNGFVARAPRAVAFDPQQPQRVYASSIAGGLFKSEDGGQHWLRRRFGSKTNYTTGISVDPVDHSVYVATFTNLGIETNGIWKSTDFGETFNRIDRAPHAHPGEFLDLSGRGITVDPHRHRTIYFADRSSGIWRSRNAGATWHRVDATPVFSVTVDPADSNIVYAGTRYDGVLKSTDGGSSFTKKNNRLSGIGTSRTGSVQIDPEHPNLLYVGTEGNGVFKSKDGAETWLRINSGLNDLVVTGFVMAPGSTDTLYAATLFSSVYKKTAASK